MSFSISNNLSALGALGNKVGVTANNIANHQSDGFKKSEATLKEGENGCIEVDIKRIDTPGPVVDGTEKSNVDLAEEIPNTIMVKHSYKANIKAIEVQDELLDHLIDTIA